MGTADPPQAPAGTGCCSSEPKNATKGARPEPAGTPRLHDSLKFRGNAIAPVRRDIDSIDDDMAIALVYGQESVTSGACAAGIRDDEEFDIALDARFWKQSVGQGA